MKWLDRLRRALAVGTGNRNPALLEQGIALHEAGNLQAAHDIYAQMLRRDARDADALHLIGLIAHQQGDNARAQQLIAKAIAVRPDAPRFHFNLGNALAAQNQTREAYLSFQRAAELDPAHAAGFYNLGAALLRLDQHGEAAKALRRAFELSPDLPGLRQAFAQSLSNAAGAGALPKNAYREAADLLIEHWHATDNPFESRQLLAFALQEDRQWSLAATHYLALIEAFPDLEVAHNNLANCYNQMGRMADAIAQYREVLRLSPQNALAASGIVSCMNYNASPRELFDAHTDWARRFAAPQTAPPAYSNSRQIDRRLKLAYVSPDLRSHPVATLFSPVIERHDRSRFDITCYYNYPIEDDVSQRIRGHADHWIDIHEWNDAALAQRIREDAIDVLVDLAGHTSYGRLRAYAGKPAPVQVSWLGYFATTGMSQMDAFITDPISSPPGQDIWFSETLLRLPDTRFTFSPHDFYPPPGEPRRREPGAVNFGCLNNLAKINDDVLATWAALLEQLPKSTLLIQALALEDQPNRETFLTRCQRSGIARSRIDLRPWTALQDSARTYHDVDIALDPFPFCGGMTSFDALWMGVPVVTLAGELIAGRQTAAMLGNLGLSDLIAQDADSYIAIAELLAGDTQRLDQLRLNLRKTFADSPLCDHDKFTRSLEDAYLRLWRHWAAGPA